MNATDRQHLARLYAAVGAWPWHNRNRTATVADVAGFARRMDELQPLFMDAVQAISLNEAAGPSLQVLEAALVRLGASTSYRIATERSKG